MLLFITFLCEEEDERLLNGKLIGHELSLVMDLDTQISVFGFWMLFFSEPTPLY